MSKYVSYDKEDNVIFVDYSNITITAETLHEAEVEIIRLAKQILPQRVYLLTCFQNAKIAPEVQNNWGTYSQKALEYVKGVVRYAATDLVTNITLRSNTVRYNIQGNNSFIYPGKEAALEAIRHLEKGQG